MLTSEVLAFGCSTLRVTRQRAAALTGAFVCIHPEQAHVHAVSCAYRASTTAGTTGRQHASGCFDYHCNVDIIVYSTTVRRCKTVRSLQSRRRAERTDCLSRKPTGRRRLAPGRVNSKAGPSRLIWVRNLIRASQLLYIVHTVLLLSACSHGLGNSIRSIPLGVLGDVQKVAQTRTMLRSLADPSG